MKSPMPNTSTPHAADGAEEAERTLRLIAGLPAPDGLEDRVKAALRSAPRTGRLLQWPAAPAHRRGWLDSALARGAAAAAIVFVVAGGGWSVYSHVQPAQTPQAVAVPHVAAPGGFSSADAIRTPQTLNGPVLKHPAPRHSPAAAPATQGAAKAAIQARKKPADVGKAGRARKAAKESSQ
ncbi:MAG: hypothetical protein KGM96_08695 [Acidobacteriota bacterium]|nr:hypothetical protein [Acidobacteriota bacterium]